MSAPESDGEAGVRQQATFITSALQHFRTPMPVVAWYACTPVDDKLLFCSSRCHDRDGQWLSNVG